MKGKFRIVNYRRPRPGGSNRPTKGLALEGTMREFLREGGVLAVVDEERQEDARHGDEEG